MALPGSEGPDRRPRVGLVVETLGGFGGLELSAPRHVRLLADHLAVVPIALEQSAERADWVGRVDAVPGPDGPAYRIVAADLRSDELLADFDHRHQTYADQLARVARQERLAAIHVYGAFGLRPLVAAMAAIRCDVPLIVSFRGSDFDLRAFGPTLAHLQAAVQAARACSCLNASSGRLIARLLRPPCPVRVIPNHVDPAEFTPDLTIDLPCPPPVIATLGVFRRLTGLDFLLRAFEHLAARRAGSLALIGPFQPIEAYHYSALIDGLTHGRRVHRVGRVPHAEVLAYLKAADLLVFPATSDGCPSKVLEAMLAGCAIVASNVGGIPELLRDGTDGVLVDPRDPKQLADAIDGLLDDSERRRQYGESARARARTVFSPARLLAAWLECYRDAGL